VRRTTSRTAKPPRLDEVAPGRVAVGRIAGAHGVRGELKVVPLAPASVLTVGRAVIVAAESREIARVRHGGRIAYVTLTGVDSREAAKLLSGAYLEVAERDLPPLPDGEYYRFQLIGLSVRGLEGRQLGSITDVFSTPENDVYVVSGESGDVLIPAVEDVVQSVDLGAGEIVIEIIPGLIP
jgi:16S rRNA processing protein RimM